MIFAIFPCFSLLESAKTSPGGVADHNPIVENGGRRAFQYSGDFQYKTPIDENRKNDVSMLFGFWCAESMQNFMGYRGNPESKCVHTCVACL